MRVPGASALTVVCLSLSACTTPAPPVDALAAPVLKPVTGPVDAARARRAGAIDFQLSPSGSGSYAGWQLRVLAAASGAGDLIPFTSAAMVAGSNLRAELRPDRYRLQVLLRGEVQLDRWVDVAPDSVTAVQVDIGMLTNDITVREHLPLLAPAGIVRPLAQNFRPAVVEQAAPGGQLQRVARPVASASLATPPASKPSPGGCAQVQGEFVADAGLSRLTLDGAGKGRLRQRTAGGGEVYGFEVPFSYRGSPDAMAFEYGQAIYRDAAGTVLSRRQIRGGSVACRYDGTRLTINGKDYLRN